MASKITSIVDNNGTLSSNVKTCNNPEYLDFTFTFDGTITPGEFPIYVIPDLVNIYIDNYTQYNYTDCKLHFIEYVTEISARYIMRIDNIVNSILSIEDSLNQENGVGGVLLGTNSRVGIKIPKSEVDTFETFYHYYSIGSTQIGEGFDSINNMYIGKMAKFNQNENETYIGAHDLPVYIYIYGKGGKDIGPNSIITYTITN